MILGCGVGGLVVASRLAKLARKSAAVTVVERKTHFQLPASFPWVVMGWRQTRQVQRTLAPLSRMGIKVINDTVTGIDPLKKRVKTDSSELAYDHLIIAMGAEYSPEQIRGFDEHAHHMYDLEHAVKFRDSVQNFPGGKLAVGISRVPFKCPAAPYEAALLLDDYFRRERKSASITFFTPEAQPVPAAGPVIGKQVERLLASRQIQYQPKKKLSKVSKDRAVFEDGTEITFDLLMAVPPHRCPKPVFDAGLTDSSGWVPVNPYTMTTKVEDVYALGDVASIETPHGHVPFLPKAGVFARGQAEVLANNLAVAITGKGERKAWDGTGECFLEVSRSESAYLKGTFLSNPPRLEFHPPRRKWHYDKVAFERDWIRTWL